MIITFDLETTGLPIFNLTENQFYDPNELDKYDSSRIVSIGWILGNYKGEIENKGYHIIKPDNWKSSKEAENVHNLSHDTLEKDGILLRDALNMFVIDLTQATHILGHNVMFDFNILKSESIRYGFTDIIEQLDNKSILCTMKIGKKYLNKNRCPRLVNLYKQLFDEEADDAHNALSDALYSYKCYVKMINE
jgi:DNA polymerase-3 subunit alpha